MSETTQLTTLPPVAKSFFAFCKKCDADRYHVVLAHTTARSAKIKCEVCGSTKSWSLPKAPAKAKVTAKSAARAASTGGKPLKTLSVRGEAARKSAYNAQYEDLMKNNKDKAPKAYNMKQKFELHHLIDHPKFGLGIVTAVFEGKMEVSFLEEAKVLIHQRP